MPVVRRALLLLPLLWAGFAWGLGPYVTEPAPALAYSELPKYFSDVVDSHGVRLVSTNYNQRTNICDLWWRKEIPVQPARIKAPDLVYANLRPGTFLGLVSIFTPQEDFRHHMLKPGLYTMRYAQPEQNGDDHAVSPFRDFVILSPAWVDKDPNAKVSMDQITKWGILVSHEDEPAVLSLIPANPAYKKSPSPVADGRGFVAVQLNLKQKGKSADLPFAVLIVRPPYENEGS